MTQIAMLLRPLRAIRVFALSLIAYVGMSVSGAAETQLVFGTYAADKPTETVRQFKPFLSFLERELAVMLNEPVTIKMKISKEYSDSIDQLASGAVDFARFGPASYVTVKMQNEDTQIIAIESKGGKKRFKGVIAVHVDSPLTSLADLSNLRFAFGDELSTIGRYLAQSELLEAGISGQDLSQFEYLGRHDLVGTAVGNGSFDVGALKESTFKKLVKKGVPIRALVKFDNVTKPWIASSQMSPQILNAMQAIMLDPKNLDEMKSIAKNGFLAGNDADYDLIREAMARSANF
ncbi:PhnD/SsuA/transferrin family substrate-binding protein [Amylibacter sp.]|nr:PhnD/SsuA/transferrin family substrate-binding protein [Amylibacter sp.]